MDEISENIFNEELDKLFMVKIQIREEFSCIRVTKRAWILKTTIIWSRSDQAQREREYICVADWGWKVILIKKSYARSCREIEELKRCCYPDGNYQKKKNEDWNNFYAAWSGITNSESILLRSWLTQQLWRTYVPQQARVESWISEQKFTRRRRISRSYCSGSRKSKQPARWRTSSIQNQIREKISVIMKN